MSLQESRSCFLGNAGSGPTQLVDPLIRQLYVRNIFYTDTNIFNLNYTPYINYLDTKSYDRQNLKMTYTGTYTSILYEE